MSEGRSDGGLKSASPLVSVVIPTHNRQEMLERALNSVIAQTYPALEILVVDDASGDGTADLVGEVQSRSAGVRYIRKATPEGAPAARNAGIQAAEGELVTFLDDDDEYLPERIEKLVRAYHPAFAFVCSDYFVAGARGRSHHRLPGVITLADMYYRNRVGNTVLVATSLARRVGGFDETLEARQDYDLWLRLLEAAPRPRAKVVPEPLHVIHKAHEQRITSSSRVRRGQLRFLRKHKAKWSHCQRRFQSFGMRKRRGKRISWMDRWCNWFIRKRLKLFPPRFWAHCP